VQAFPPTRAREEEEAGALRGTGLLTVAAALRARTGWRGRGRSRRCGGGRGRRRSWRCGRWCRRRGSRRCGRWRRWGRHRRFWSRFGCVRWGLGARDDFLGHVGAWGRRAKVRKRTRRCQAADRRRLRGCVDSLGRRSPCAVFSPGRRHPDGESASECGEGNRDRGDHTRTPQEHVPIAATGISSAASMSPGSCT
jgi:hypothetical protein